MSLDHLTSSGLYVHIPFCKTKCPYCDFYSVTDDTLISAYLAALDAEARLYRDQFPAFDSLFLGGGTPSCSDAAQLAGLWWKICGGISPLPRTVRSPSKPTPTILPPTNWRSGATWALTA